MKSNYGSALEVCSERGCRQVYKEGEEGNSKKRGRER